MSRYPDFFLVGAQRSGTTSLYEYLRQHPQIFLSPRKETHFFTHDRVSVDADLHIRSEKQYLHLFRNAKSTNVVGEVCPSYLWHPETAQRIYAQNPNAKIIAVLRDPIARAYSQYRMDLADGLAGTPFYELIVREYENGEKVYGTGHLYVELGMYATQLASYWKVFGKARVLVLSFDDLGAEPRRVLGKIAAFLDISSEPFARIDAEKIYNQIRIPRSSLLRSLLNHRLMRRLYRRVMPQQVRTTIRTQAFVPMRAPAVDVRANEFLRALYTPEMRELETGCGISFAQFKVVTQ